MHLPVSEELSNGRYRLTELLGIGGMAEVHRAWDTRLHRFVAVKRFRFVPDDATERRIATEVHALAELSHPGLVSVFDAGVCGGTPYVVLQLVEGHTLRDEIAQGPMSIERVRHLGTRLTDALAHVHAHGMVHRDIKPANILIDADGSPYLADFGLARLAGATRVTASGQLVGTPAYLAPEQVRGEDVGRPADVYALGLVLLECLTGRLEYDGSEIEAAVARLHRPPVVPRDLPPDLVRLLMLMTSLAARRRPTAAQCASILQGMTEELDPPTERITKPRPIRQKAVYAYAATGGAIIAGVLSAVLSTSQAATSEPTTPPPATFTPSAPPTVVTAVTSVVTQTSVVPVQAPPMQIPPPAGKLKGQKPGKGHGHGEGD